MFRLKRITEEWEEAGTLPAQINLYGFWDQHYFLTKSGGLGAALKIGGIDYESLDHQGRDYAVKRLEAAFGVLDDKTRLYQVLFKRNRPEISYEQYENPLVRATVEQRIEFLEKKAERLYQIEIFWIVMVDGNYSKAGLLHALAHFGKEPKEAFRELKSLLSGNAHRTFLYEQIKRDRAALSSKVESLIGQLSDLTKIELLSGASSQ
jgi:type IV secretion system protein TrbE